MTTGTGSYVCDGCGRRVFPVRTDYISDGTCPDCGGLYIDGRTHAD